MTEDRCHFCGDYNHKLCGCMYECTVCNVIGHEHTRDGEGTHNYVNPNIVSTLTPECGHHCGTINGEIPHARQTRHCGCPECHGD